MSKGNEDSAWCTRKSSCFAILESGVTFEVVNLPNELFTQSDSKLAFKNVPISCAIVPYFYWNENKWTFLHSWLGEMTLFLVMSQCHMNQNVTGWDAKPEAFGSLQRLVAAHLTRIIRCYWNDPALCRHASYCHSRKWLQAISEINHVFTQCSSKGRERQLPKSVIINLRKLNKNTQGCDSKNRWTL